MIKIKHLSLSLDESKKLKWYVVIMGLVTGLLSIVYLDRAGVWLIVSIDKHKKLVMNCFSFCSSKKEASSGKQAIEGDGGTCFNYFNLLSA